MADIERVVSFLSGFDAVDDEGERGYHRHRRRTRTRRVDGFEGGDVLEDARDKILGVLKPGTAGRMSPWSLFDFLDPEGKGEV